MTCTASRDEQKLLFWADWWITHCVILHITSLQKSHRCGQEHWRKQTSSAQSRTSGKTNPSETHTKLIGFRIREESAAEMMLHSSKEHPPSGFVFSKMTLIIRIRMTCLMECVRYKWLTAANTRSQPIVLSKACSCVCAHTHTRGGPPPTVSAKSLPCVSSEVCFTSQARTTHGASPWALALIPFVLKSMFRY